MSDLYEKCPACRRAGHWETFAVTDRGLHKVEAPDSCPLCRGSGFVPTGLTTGQVERLVAAERARLGDPGAGPVVTLRFRDEAAKQLFVVSVAMLLGNDDDLVFGMGPADGGTILGSDLFDVRIEKVDVEMEA